MKYVALLRGINVGGNNKVSMSELRSCFESLELSDVSTYINSGNVLFTTNQSDTTELKSQIESCLITAFGFAITVVVFEAQRYITAIEQAPDWWGQNPDWKHNVLFIVEPHTSPAVLDAIGELRPDIEAVQAGDGMIFQSLEYSKFRQTTTGKLASNPIYKSLTIRNYNTAQKLASLLAE